ncbi:hypothetical protein [Mesorhizobium denitrificans]|nr:hypothetical protein [Mesorhizobium denitrificans]
MKQSTGKTISRRAVLGSLCSLPLAGCQDGGASVRYRVIAKVLYNGQTHEASTVMECRYSRLKNSLVGMGGSTTLYGEALIFDLPAGGTIFILPYLRSKGGGFSEIYEPGILETLGIKNSVGGLNDDDLQRLAEAAGRMPFNFYGRYPVMVAFQDETKPKTIFEVLPGQMNESFAGVTFIGLDIEFTDAPITDLLRKRLTWLNLPSRTELFEREPPGSSKPDWELPLGHFVNDRGIGTPYFRAKGTPV